jgi:hypothetical protein
VNVEEVRLEAFIGMSNVAVTADVMATPVAPLAGVTALTAGTFVGQLLVQVPPPPPLPPHPAITRLTAASNQAEVTRITNFSYGSVRTTPDLILLSKC